MVAIRSRGSQNEMIATVTDAETKRRREIHLRDRLMAKQHRVPTPRFGIGEWYGHSFASLTAAQRREYAAIALHQSSPVEDTFLR